MNKNVIRGAAVLGIILVVFCVIMFVLPTLMNAIFWLALVFGIISIGIAGYALYAGFVKGDAARSKLYGFPVARVGTVYMVTQLIISLLFAILAKYIPVFVVVIVCIVALAAAAIGVISTEAVREEIEHQDKELKKKVSVMRSLQSKVRMLVSQCDDEIFSKELEKFSDDLKYSDPVSSDAIEDIENNLAELIDEMQKATVEGEFCIASDLCKKASAVLAERNRLCKLNK